MYLKIDEENVIVIFYLLSLCDYTLNGWLIKQMQLHLLPAIGQTWTAPVSVFGHNWPTFSLFLPFHTFLFPLPWAQFFVSSSVQNAEGGGVSIILARPSYQLAVRKRSKFWS